MDVRLARTIISLQSATAYLKKDNDSAVKFVKKNKSYFPNENIKKVTTKDKDDKDKPNFKIPTFVELNT
jgi:hypothetical protein